MNRLDPFLHPDSIAIVGASDVLDSPAGRIQRYLTRYGFTGKIYPVNPRRTQVQGLPASPTVQQIGAPVDVAVIAVRAELVIDALRDCAEAKVAAVVVISSGFSEVGAAGNALEVELREVVRQSPYRLLGPNTSGMVSVSGHAPLTFMSGLDKEGVQPRDDGVAVVSQSGAVGSFLFNLGQASGLGIGTLLNTGNEADLTFSLAVDALLEAEEPPGVILGYVEGIRDAPDLLTALRRLRDTDTTMAVVKIGRSDGGARAAASHTGSMTGSDEVYDGVFRQFGVIRADGIGDLADLGRVAAHGHLGLGNRLTIVTLSGGAGALAVDSAIGLPFELAEWDEEWRERLRQVLPAFASVQNPIDVTGSITSDPTLLAKALDVVAEHPATDIVLVIAGDSERTEDELMKAITDAARPSSKSFFVAWIGGSGRPVKILNNDRIAAFPDPTQAVRAIGRVLAAKRLRAAMRSEKALPTTSENATRSGPIRGSVDEHRAKELLREFGLPMAAEVVADSREAAQAAAQQIGFPVVVKLLSSQLQHKTEHNAVIVGVRDGQGLDDATRALSAVADELGLPERRFLIQEQADGHLEVLLGMTRDETFGPVITIGLGGIFTELIRDTAVLVAPFTPGDVGRALDSLRSRDIFTGLRGKRPVDREALISAICAFGEFVSAHGDELVEVDINPLMVGGERVPIAAVDALIVAK